ISEEPEVAASLVTSDDDAAVDAPSEQVNEASDEAAADEPLEAAVAAVVVEPAVAAPVVIRKRAGRPLVAAVRSEEHTSELQSLMRNSYAVFCLKKKKSY